MRRLLAITLTIVVLFGTACSSGVATPPSNPTPVPNDITAVGFDARTLAEGKLDELPTDPTYVSYIEISQPGADRITHAHVVGFVYALSGVPRLTLADGSPTDLNPGTAGFIGDNVNHTHENPTNTANDWLFVSVRPTSARTAAPPIPGAKVVYATDDLEQLQKGPYTERLMLVSLQQGGHGAPHMHGGVETLYVLQGTIRLQLSGQSVTLEPGQGFSHAPATPIQDINAGTGEARMLAHFVTPDGHTFRSDLNHAP